MGTQDPKNKRKIIPDDRLGTILTPPVDIFSMNKQLSKHCWAVEGVSSQNWESLHAPCVSTVPQIDRKYIARGADLIVSRCCRRQPWAPGATEAEEHKR